MGAVSIYLLKDVVVLLLLMGILKVSSVDAALQDNNAGFDYYPWSSKGPDQWGNLRPEWATCRDGREQSPIVLPTRGGIPVFNPQDLQINYQPASTTLLNRGHDIAIQWNGDAGSARINGLFYSLIQCHWHSPAEHIVAGLKYVLEMHCVHQRVENNKTTLAVIATLYNFGLPDPFLLELQWAIKAISGGAELQINTGIKNPRNIMISNEYYRFEGSLTTPPCSEGVIWTIDRRVRTASFEQVTLLKNAVEQFAWNNARPVQPLNGRNIFWYRPSPSEFQDNLISEMK